MVYQDMQVTACKRADNSQDDIDSSDLSPHVINYIHKLKTQYEKDYQTLRTTADEYEHKYNELKEKYDLLLYKRFMRSAEQLLTDEEQPLLFTEEDEGHASSAAAETPETEIKQISSYQRKKSGRKPLPEHLERRERIIDIPEAEKNCPCGSRLAVIGEAVYERLQIIPPQIYVEKIIRPKYACRSCEGVEDESRGAVHIAPPESSMIPKSIASPSVLSWIFTYKFNYHLPHYRQEQLFTHYGIQISRQDMSN